MALPPASVVLLWLTIAVGFVFFTAVAVGTVALLGYLGSQVLRSESGGTTEGGADDDV